jgi:hypothetical protein
VDPSTVIFGWFLQLGLGAVVTFFALVFSCKIAFEEANHSRLFGSAIAIRLIDMIPEILETAGFGIPIWSSVAATVIAYIALVPLLTSWAGMNAAKAIYVSLLALIFVSVFQVLVSTSS